MKRSISSLKKKCWKLCSEYVRRGSADPNGYSICVCCGLTAHWKNLQAGHLVSGRRLGILFDLRGIYSCCYGCNIMKGGNIQEFNAFIDSKYGLKYRLDLVDDLRGKSKQPTKWSTADYEAKIQEFKDLLNGLPKE